MDENPTRRKPVVTLVIIGACLWVYFFWQPNFGETGSVVVETPAGLVQMDEALAFNLEYAAIPCEVVQGEPLNVDELMATFGPRGDGDSCGVGDPSDALVFPDKSVWRSLFVTMFLHGGVLHLGGNLLFLWIFGNNIEDHLGHVKYALFYVLSGLVASAAHIVLNLDSTIPVVGASGAIAGVMGAYLVWFPNAPVRTLVFLGLFVTVFDVRAVWLLGFWFISQFFTGANSGVAWAAHVGGFVFGVVVGLVVRASTGVRRRAWVADHRGGLGPWDSTGGIGRGPYRRGF